MKGGKKQNKTALQCIGPDKKVIEFRFNETLDFIGPDVLFSFKKKYLSQDATTTR